MNLIQFICGTQWLGSSVHRLFSCCHLNIGWVVPSTNTFMWISIHRHIEFIPILCKIYRKTTIEWYVMRLAIPQGLTRYMIARSFAQMNLYMWMCPATSAQATAWSSQCIPKWNQNNVSHFLRRIFLRFVSMVTFHLPPIENSYLASRNS